MTALHDLVGADRRLVVTTSLCANPADRELERGEVLPVQLLGEDGWSPIEWLKDMGELGLSALTVVDEDRLLVVDGDVIYVARRGAEITSLPGAAR